MALNIICMIGVCLFTLAGGKLDINGHEIIKQKLTFNGKVIAQQVAVEKTRDTIQLEMY
ncbi:MAG: hypothetical protein ABIH39_00265 [Candidatus Margulisiibacteriota bacterium]